jgi:hypothetical protein
MMLPWNPLEPEEFTPPQNSKKFEGNHAQAFSLPSSPTPNRRDMLRRTAVLLALLSTFASSRVIDHDVLQCTTKAFTSAWSETFNNLVGLTPNYLPGTFIAVDCTQIPNMRCDAISEDAKCVIDLCCLPRVDPAERASHLSRLFLPAVSAQVVRHITL